VVTFILFEIEKPSSFRLEREAISLAKACNARLKTFVTFDFEYTLDFLLALRAHVQARRLRSSRLDEQLPSGLKRSSLRVLQNLTTAIN
jgi:hypothetical protein